jgi:hypothetical protein
VILALVMLALGLGNLGKAAMAIRYADLLSEVPLTLTWQYLTGMGALWGIVFIGCSVGLMRFRTWGRWATLISATAYQIHIWVNHLLFDASDYARQTRPRDLVLTALFLALVWGLLCLPSVRGVFNDH